MFTILYKGASIIVNAYWLPQIGLTSMLCNVVDLTDVCF